MSSNRYDRILRWVLGIAALFIVLFLLSLIRRRPSEAWQERGDGPRIGVVEIKGVIVNSERAIRQLDQFSRRKDIEAILVDIDSPGGTVAASQEIYAELCKIVEKGDKPVIASLGTVAASGGYYVALAADTIVAGPATTTGSIGVIFEYPVAADLMDKIGLQVEVIKSGALKDMGSPYRFPTDSDRRNLQGVVDDLHAQFAEVVALERNLTPGQVKAVAGGEIFTGKQALDLGLVDILGTFEDAVLLAGRLTGSMRSPVIIRPHERKRVSLWELIFGEDSYESQTYHHLPQYLMK